MIEAHIIAGTIGTFFVKKFDLDFGGEDTSLPPPPPPPKKKWVQLACAVQG